ncbi:MAG: MBL fold metallo-hydrolase, partial [Actinobacteria bacterium]|nr:MBL fold metallo-hydrolase [Actinomycetota bacterium]
MTPAAPAGPGSLHHLRIRAGNPGPYTLDGTNTWVLGRDPAYVIDPGPALPDHLDAIVEALDDRGGLGAILLTHDHPDHAEAVAPLRARLPAPVAAARGPVDVRLADGDSLGPVRVIATPGHAPDHLAFLAGRACFTGDAVLGTGSV